MGETRAEDTPFPAEADLTQVVELATGPVGRFQVVCGPGPEGTQPTAFLIDTIDGRSWLLNDSTRGRWRPIPFEPGVPPPAP